MTAKDAQRYTEALHGVQSAITYEQSIGASDECSPKHLRVGVNSALLDSAALASILIDKGLFTMDEYQAALAHFAERELMRYQARNPGINFR